MNLPKAGNEPLAAQGVGIVAQVVDRPLAEGGVGGQFRPTANSDYGIDGTIELLLTEGQEAYASGRILSVQVKTGPSFFKASDGDSWKVYIDKVTVNYWRNHSIPVLLLLVDASNNDTYWVRGDEDGWEETKENFKILVPKGNMLGSSARPMLEEIAKNQSHADRKLAELEFQSPFMDWIFGSDNLFGEVVRFESDGKVVMSAAIFPGPDRQPHDAMSWSFFVKELEPEEAFNLSFPYLDSMPKGAFSLKSRGSHDLAGEASKLLFEVHNVDTQSAGLNISSAVEGPVKLNRVGLGYVLLRPHLLS